MSAIKSIARARIVAFVEELGLDAGEVLSITIEPLEITAEVLERDVEGRVTLAGGQGGPPTTFVMIEVVA